MRRLLTLKIGWTLALFAFLDLICVGGGMGVPFFCILFGLPLGWYIARRITARPQPLASLLGRVLLWAALAAAFTMVVMVVIWAHWVGVLFDPLADLAQSGVPMILYEPRASLIGWVALMIVISPFLQLLMTLFAAHVTLLIRSRRGADIVAEQAAG